MAPRLPRSSLTTRLSGSARETEHRIRNIFLWKKKRPPMPVLALAAVLIAMCGGLVSCQERDNTPADFDPHTATPLNAPQFSSSWPEEETVPFSNILGYSGTVTRSDIRTDDGHTYDYEFQADLPGGTSFLLASLSDPVYADLDGDGQLDLLSAPGDHYLKVWRKWPDGSIRIQSLAPAAAEVMSCSTDDITTLLFHEADQTVTVGTSTGREETYSIATLLAHSYSGTIQVYPTSDDTAPLISHGTNPEEYLSIAFFEHMDLDGVGDMDDSVTIFSYGSDVPPGPLTVVEVTLGTGETLRWEEETTVFPNCLSAYLTAPDHQSLVLDLVQPYSVPRYTDYVVLSVENGTLRELYRLKEGEGPAWISGAYTQERPDGLSDLYLPVLSDDKAYTLWYTLSWSEDQFVLLQPEIS